MTARYACRACLAPLDVEPGLGPVDARSGDHGGTFDYCPATPDHRHAVTAWHRLP
jgi:hypothetical protein